MSVRLITLCCALISLSLAAYAEDDRAASRKVVLSLSTAVQPPPGAASSATHDSALSFPTRPESASVAISRVEQTKHRSARLRHIEYSEDQLVIVGLAADLSERTRTVMADPRLVRAESSFSDEPLPSTRLYRPVVDFSVTIDDESVAIIRILKPVWNGTEWLFDLVAETPIQ